MADILFNYASLCVFCVCECILWESEIVTLDSTWTCVRNLLIWASNWHNHKDLQLNVDFETAQILYSHHLLLLKCNSHICVCILSKLECLSGVMTCLRLENSKLSASDLTCNLLVLTCNFETCLRLAKQWLGATSSYCVYNHICAYRVFCINVCILRSIMATIFSFGKHFLCV